MYFFVFFKQNEECVEIRPWEQEIEYSISKCLKTNKFFHFLNLVLSHYESFQRRNVCYKSAMIMIVMIMMMMMIFCNFVGNQCNFPALQANVM